MFSMSSAAAKAITASNESVGGGGQPICAWTWAWMRRNSDIKPDSEYRPGVARIRFFQNSRLANARTFAIFHALLINLCL
jgi:hypothetical protein